MTSKRRKKALAAAKARGVKLDGDRGNLAVDGAKAARRASWRQAKAQRRAGDLAGIIAAIQAAGATSRREIAAALNAQDVPIAKGGGKWAAVQVARVLAQMRLRS